MFSIAAENIAAILNSPTTPTDFSPQEYQRLVEKYLTLSRENDRLVKAIRARTEVDVDYLRQVLQTDFPLYTRLQEYFSRLRGGDLKSVDQAPFIFDGPTLGGSRGSSCSIEVNMGGESEMRLASESNPDVMSVFSATAVSVFAEGPSIISNQGPFGIRFSDFPPRVISQMLSTHTEVTASSCRYPRKFLGAYTHLSLVASWRGMFQWAGFEHVSRAKKFMRIPMIGLGVTDGKDLYAKANTPRQDSRTYPNHLFLQTRACVATGHGPPPIRNQTRE